MLKLEPEITGFFTSKLLMFDQLMALRGETYRAVKNRHTERIILGNQGYFIKRHLASGWKEIFKNFMQLRLPILSAKNEWQVLQRLRELKIHVPDVVAYGCRGNNPAKQESFIITRELPSHTTLEELGNIWKTKRPDFSFKRQLIQEVARIARTLHENGINHRDFYLCHLLLANAQPLKLYVIDFHRAEIRKQVPKRWVIKDLAGLYFSSKEIGLTRTDLLRFIKEYRNNTMKEAFFWQKVKNRGDKLYAKLAK